MSRPEGQPGTAWYAVGTGFTYPAVLDPDGLVHVWRDGRWIPQPGYRSFFEPGPEWQADCHHGDGRLEYRTCDTEADCLSLRREEARQDAAERSRG